MTTEKSRTYLIQDETHADPDAMVVVTWDQLAEANDPETMDEIALLEIGESTVLGMADPIERVS